MSPQIQRVTSFFIERRGQIVGTVCRFSYGLSEEVAEDVAHDAYVIGLNQAARIAPLEDAQLWRWFLRVCVRQAKDRCRKKSHGAEIGDADGLLMELHGGHADHGWTDLLLDLPEEIRTAAVKHGGNEAEQVAAALWLVVVEDAGVTEAAALHGTHREYVSRALGTLRRCMAA